MRSETSVGVDRRAFLQSIGGGLLIALTLDHALEAQESGSSDGRPGRRCRRTWPRGFTLLRTVR